MLPVAAVPRCPGTRKRRADQVEDETAARAVVDGGMRIIADHVVSGDPADDDRVAREMSLTWWYGAFRRP